MPGRRPLRPPRLVRGTRALGWSRQPPGWLRQQRRRAVPATDRAIELARVAARAAEDKLATTITALDVSEQLALTDVFVIVSASNERQVGAIVDEVEHKLRQAGAKPMRRE